MDATTGRTVENFADLLRRHRLAAELTQEDLAARSGISVRGISDLERGTHSYPYPHTINLLANALGLSDRDRAAFLRAARRPPPAGTVRRPPAAMVTSLIGLPTPPHRSFVGREDELAQIDAMLRAAANRLVTLTGPPGVGKTRLAIEGAAMLGDAFPDGVVFVDLAPLHDAGLVLPSIAMALGIQATPGRSARETIADAVATRQSLLVLDNFEHVLDAAPALSALLQAAPSMKVLATSREALRLHGERAHAVRPLRLPDPQAPVDARTLAENAAITLFVERAREARPDFRLTDDNATAIREICVRLEGLPLAIELAAAWLRALSPDGLAMRLERRLPLLTGGTRDTPERQQTLHNAIAWSYDRLSPEEQRLLQRLSVFAGGWTLEAAEAIAGSENDSGVLQNLASLVDKSLVQVNERGPVRIYGMLATILEFAAARLAASGAEESVRRGHLGFYLDLAEEAESHLVSDVDALWIDRIEAEHDNIRAALAWALRPERALADRDRGLRLAAALWLFWYYHGHLSEGRHWIERALATTESGADPDPARAKALVGLGTLAHFQGDDVVALPRLEEGVRLWRLLDDPVGLAYALTVRGNIAEDAGDYPRAEALFVEARDLFAGVGDQVNVSVTLYHLGIVRYGQGRLPDAARFCAEALALGRQTGDPWTTANAQSYLGLIHADAGDDSASAAALAEALALYQQIGTMERIAEVIRRTAVLAHATGAAAPALRLLAAADTIARGIGAAQALPERTAYERTRDAAGDALGPNAAREATRAGQDMTLEEAIADVRRTLQDIAGDATMDGFGSA